MVFTQGLRFKPRSTAFLATSAAPIITLGLEVLVHEVIAAITTAPWSRSNAPPSAKLTGTRLLGRPISAGTSSPYSCGSVDCVPSPRLGTSEAGKDSSTDSS